MRYKMSGIGVIIILSGAMGYSAVSSADAEQDFGAGMEHELEAQSEKLFVIVRPLATSANGPSTAPDNTGALEVAKSLKVSVVSNVTHAQADMITLWPNDINPTHAFVCIENFFRGNDSARFSVQRVNLAGDPNGNVETIVKGISSCDPIKRTLWGTLVVGEEVGPGGGFYEIMDPMSLTGAAPAVITDRAAGTSTDSRVVKRKAHGQPQGAAHRRGERGALEGVMQAQKPLAGKIDPDTLLDAGLLKDSAL